LGVFYTPLTAQDQVNPGDPVVIVGGGNSAGQAATFLAARGHPVTVVIRGDSLNTSMSHYLIDRVHREPNINVLPNSVVEELDGGSRLEGIVVKDVINGIRHTLPAAALFVLIGAEPHTQWLGGAIEVDSSGFIVTGPNLGRHVRQQPHWNVLGRDPYLLETSLPGVFAAGDVRSGSVKRVASAVGEGSIAARFVSELLGRRLSAEVIASSDG
jgi:thioredoxin reductase (NADPH)